MNTSYNRLLYVKMATICNYHGEIQLLVQSAHDKKENYIGVLLGLIALIVWMMFIWMMSLVFNPNV